MSSESFRMMIAFDPTSGAGMSLSFVLVFIVFLIPMWLIVRVAKRKGYPPGGITLAVFGGWIGLAILLSLPDRTQRPGEPRSLGVADQLVALEQMRVAGSISDDDFARKRDAILARIGK